MFHTVGFLILTHFVLNFFVAAMSEEINARGFIPLSMLQPFHRDWTIKVLILCQGSIKLYNTSKGFGKLQKIISMNEKV